MPIDSKRWFENCGGFAPTHDLALLHEGIREGLIDEQDEWGCTALFLAVMSGWRAGIEALLRAGADTELRYYRTGATVLSEAAQGRHAKDVVPLLLAAGANPDASNYWGVTPRQWLPEAFVNVPERESELPDPHIQNAEHLADHHHPKFKIPSERERVSLQPGQAVNLYVYGPEDQGKQDTVKVRIVSRIGQGRSTRYVADVETELAKTHLREGMTILEFGPEHVATVYVVRK